MSIEVLNQIAVQFQLLLSYLILNYFKILQRNMIEYTQKDTIIQNIQKINGQITQKIYQRGEMLGKGGFAHCYVYKSIENEKRYATKIINKQSLLQKSKTKIKLINEIKLHKIFHHENVVEFIQVFQDQDNVYIFLELCHYKDLDSYLKRNAISILEIKQIMRGLIHGVKYLHSQNVIHRDLKLGNIFLDKERKVKIGDFGLATKVEFLNEKKRSMCGTPNFLAPEVIQGSGYSFQVDIWSIGVILYTLLVGYSPFEGNTIQETYKNIRNGYYQFPEDSSVPYSAKQLIKKILEIDPSKRYTLDEILESQFLAEEINEDDSCNYNNLQNNIGLQFSTFTKSTKKFWKNHDSLKLLKAEKQNNLRLHITANNQQDRYLMYKLTNGVIGINEKQNRSLLYIQQQHSFVVIFHQKTEKDNIIKYTQQNLPQQFHVLSKKLSKFRYNNNSTNQNHLNLKNFSKIEDEKKLVYVKRYLKYKQFWLFRLSNQTVHMKFIDGCEVLVSNKNLIWINLKNGKTLEDTLENYLQQSNTDFSKKKKYIKPIFQKKIVSQKRCSLIAV